MVKESKRTVIEGTLEDVGTGSRYAWTVDGLSLDGILNDFDGSKVRITIETIEE